MLLKWENVGGIGDWMFKAKVSSQSGDLAVAKSERPGWDQYFLGIAASVAMRSTCRKVRCGAVLVDSDQRIVSTGYNGAHRGAPNCSDHGKCLMDVARQCRSVSAEANALMNKREPARGCKLYIAAIEEDGQFVRAEIPEADYGLLKNAQLAELITLGADGSVQAARLGGTK